MNRITALQDRPGRPGEAAATWREAVRELWTRLDPIPGSVFGAQMAGDLLDAVTALPAATAAEKRAAADLVLNHKVASAAMKDKARRVLAALGKD